MLYVVTKRIEFCIGHRLIDGYEGPCSGIHGHNLTAEIVIHSSILNEVGMVIDFGIIKDRVKRWIDSKWDHGMIVNTRDQDLIKYLRETKQKHYITMGNPTMENMAAELFAHAATFLAPPLAPIGGKLAAVRIWETTSSVAEYKEVV